MKLKKFKKKTAVKINSKEDYLLLMELAEKAGWKWFSGHNATHFNDKVGYYNSDYISFTTSNKTLARISKTVLDDLLYLYNVITMRQAVKFEVGDKVRIRKDLDKLDATEPPKIIDSMLDAAGDECIITDIPPGHKPNWYGLDSVLYCWLKKWLEPVASCDAVDPEKEQEKEPEQVTGTEPEYFNGDVVCVNSHNAWLTNGKVYKFVDGYSTYDDGDWLPFACGQVKNVGDLNSKSESDFIEVSERGEKPEGFTGKVICTKSKNSFITTGKIYEFVNGVSLDGDGENLPAVRPIKSVEELNDKIHSDFIEVVE